MNIQKLQQLSPYLAFAVGQPKYSVEFISAIGCWQNYGAADRETVKRIKKLKILEVLKHTSAPLYRLMGVKPQVLANLYLGKNYRYKDVSSWTKDPKIAQKFIESRWFEEFNDPHLKVAIVLKKSFSNVLIDLDALWKDKDFRDSLSYWEDVDINAIECYEGIEFEGAQQEVVCKPFIFEKEDLYMLWSVEEQKWVNPPENMTLKDIKTHWLESASN